MEIWKDIKGYEGIYQISNFGRVKSYAKYEKGKILKGSRHNFGYKKYMLKNKMYYAHRLVAQAFIPNPENKPQVNHIDSNPKNNNYTNLEWSTQLENNLHAIKNGSRLKYNVKKVIKLYNSGLTLKQVAKKFDGTIQGVRDVLIRNGVETRNNTSYGSNYNEKCIIETYLKGYSAKKTGKIFKISDETVYKILRKNNIRSRSYKEAAKLKNIIGLQDEYEISDKLGVRIEVV